MGDWVNIHAFCFTTSVKYTVGAFPTVQRKLRRIERRQAQRGSLRDGYSTLLKRKLTRRRLTRRQLTRRRRISASQRGTHGRLHGCRCESGPP